jgi:hypothetical protein
MDLTTYSGIFRMFAVMLEPTIKVAILQMSFSTDTSHFIHGYWARPSTKVTTIVGCPCTTKSQLATHNYSIPAIPVVVANGEPARNADRLVKNLHTATEIAKTVTIH